jgi:hypothetical protein
MNIRVAVVYGNPGLARFGHFQIAIEDNTEKTHAKNNRDPAFPAYKATQVSFGSRLRLLLLAT